MKDNCRNANKCIYCENWIGTLARVDYLTGEAKHVREKGLCKLDDSDEMHSSESVCSRFSRKITYC